MLFWNKLVVFLYFLFVSVICYTRWYFYVPFMELRNLTKIDPIPRQGNISFVTLIVPIIANIVSLNPAQARCTRYNIMW
jgi:hypothetical protein